MKEQFEYTIFVPLKVSIGNILCIFWIISSDMKTFKLQYLNYSIWVIWPITCCK